MLGDGVYYQNLVITRGGTRGKPITLRAAKGGAATLSGAVAPGKEKLKFELIEGDLYRAAVPHRVWWVMGPRWAGGDEIANRPAIPAALPRKWVGLENRPEGNTTPELMK